MATDARKKGTGHGAVTVLWDNLGDGWRIECLCGFTTGAYTMMEDTGRDFDAHLISEGLLQ